VEGGNPVSDIDNRIVFMQFDNAAFERRLAETIKSLDGLNKTIENAGKSKGLLNIGKHAKQIDFDPASRSAQGLLGHIKNFRLHTMVDQVSSVSASFLAMSTIAVTALSQITSAAFNAGGQIVKALTIAPVMDGLSEYETNMNSIQTILSNTASKGTTLDDVNTALEELNVYSDKTIYNFAQMAKNIGAFTAAGVDLDSSVNAIKGIANLSAASGASAEDASRAMQQLSQAMSSGKVTLMDWRSVENANIGGEMFKKTLFETGKALKTLKGVSMDTTFEEWEQSAGKFRDTLTDEWITGDVLSTALSTFTGDLSRTQLRSLGYTEEQTKALMAQAEIAVDAATDVKTLRQLMGTLKEAMGTGWATSFRLIFGDFKEAKELWSGAYDYLSGIIGKGAEARNSMLLDWKDGGGRDSMIRGFMYLFDAIKNIIAPVKEAFRSIFPKKTGDDLVELTKKFENWARFLKPTLAQSRNLYLIGRSIGEVFKILGTILGALRKTVRQVWDAFSDGGKKTTGALQKFASWLTFLKQSWVDDGGIADFFNRIAYYIINPQRAIKDLVKWVKNFFDTISTAEGAAEFLGGLGERFTWLKGIVRMIGVVGDWLVNIFDNVPGAISSAIGKVKDFFGGILDGLTNLGSEGPVNAESAGRLIGLGFLGGIFLTLRKIMKDGIKIDTGFAGMMESLGDAFSGLTDTLKAMQTKLKADALMRIAIAIGVLSLAVLLLSTIDPDDMTKAFIALGVGFAQLVGAMAMLNSFTGPTSTMKLMAVSVAVLVLAGAMVIMSWAVKSMGKADLEQIGKGLLGIGGALLILAVFMRLIQGATSGIIRTGVGLIFLGVALLIIAQAIKSFGNMEWDVMKQGMIGMAGALLIIAAAMWAMPPGMLAQAVSLIGISIALVILGKAVEGFGTMDWDVMKQGLIGVGAALGLIAIAAWLMPRDLLLTAMGLIVMSVALNLIGVAVSGLGKMAGGDLLQGLGALAGGLLLLGLAAYFLGNPVVAAGAAVMIVIAAAAVVLALGLEKLADIGWQGLLVGIAGLAGAIIVLGLVSSIMAQFAPAMVATAIGMGSLAISFILFGVALRLVVDSIVILSKIGPKAVDRFLDAVEKFLDRTPGFITQFFKSMEAALKGLQNVLPILLDLIGELVVGVLKILADAIPELARVINELLRGLIKIIRERGPELIRAFVELVSELVQAFADHSEEITQGIIDMLNGIMNTIAANAGDLTQAFSDMFVGLVEGLADQVDPMVTAVVNFLVAVMEATADNIDELVTAYVDLMLAIFSAIADKADDLVTGFVEMLVAVLEAILNGMDDLVNAFVDIVVSMIERTANAVKRIGDAVDVLMKAIGDEMIRAAENSAELFEAGRKAIEKFADGLDDNLPAICRAAGRIMFRLIMCIPEAFGALLGQGAATMGTFIAGIFSRIGELIGLGASFISQIVTGVLGAIGQIRMIGGNIIAQIWAGITGLWGQLTSIGGYVIAGLRQGISNAWSGLVSYLEGLWNALPEQIRSLWEERSPSRVFMRIGQYAGDGLAIGLTNGLAPLQSIAADAANNAVSTLADRTSAAVIDAQKKLAMGYDGLGLFNPVIRPELDLSGVALEARRLGDILDYAKIDTSASFGQAAEIASAAMESLEAQRGTGTGGETTINFEQHNHSPVALPAKYIFRKTRSTLAKAKQDLEIP
jgi:tape measure domain-containing protein